MPVFDMERLAYNKFTEFSNLCYNILAYLMVQNEDIWKLLKYDTPDPLSKPNLTLEEKRKMIYDGNGDSAYLSGERRARAGSAERRRDFLCLSGNGYGACGLP